MRLPHALCLLSVSLVAGCRPGALEPPGGGSGAVAGRCFRLDATPTVPDLLPLSLTIEFPAPVSVPPPHGGVTVDGTWTSDREVHGLRRGDVRGAWADGGRISLGLQPMPADVGVLFVGEADSGDADGGVAVTGWSGEWQHSGEVGRGSPVGTFVMRRLPAGAACDAP